MSSLLRRLLHFLRRSQHAADLRDEIEAHRAHRQDALERDGLTSDAAARASQRAIGNVTLAVEDARDVCTRLRYAPVLPVGNGPPLCPYETPPSSKSRKGREKTVNGPYSFPFVSSTKS
jgi:hypothetical protein